MTLVSSSRFSDPNTRRRVAIRAAHELDEDSLVELLNTYLTEGGRRREKTSAQTRKTYTKAIRKFLCYCRDGRNRLEIRTAKSAEINTWLDLLRRRGLRGSTASTHLSGVRALYGALEWAEAVERNPAANARAMRDETPGHAQKRPLTREERSRLIELPGKRHAGIDPRFARDRAILALGSRAGLRAEQDDPDRPREGRQESAAAHHGGHARGPDRLDARSGGPRRFGLRRLREPLQALLRPPAELPGAARVDERVRQTAVPEGSGRSRRRLPVAPIAGHRDAHTAAHGGDAPLRGDQGPADGRRHSRARQRCHGGNLRSGDRGDEPGCGRGRRRLTGRVDTKALYEAQRNLDR
jgi:Phage integrase, N-terminal SAM-like domain